MGAGSQADDGNGGGENEEAVTCERDAEVGDAPRRVRRRRPIWDLRAAGRELG